MICVDHLLKFSINVDFVSSGSRKKTVLKVISLKKKREKKMC